MATLRGSASLRGRDNLTRTLGEIRAKIEKAATVRVGFLENATYPDGTSVPMVAAIQEFGAPRVGIPPRPFFRTMIAEEAPKWPKLVAAALKASDNDAARALAMVGEDIAGALRQSIIRTNEPALSPVTLLLRDWRSKGRKINATVVAEARAAVARGEKSDRSGTGAKPLIDTGVMANSIGYAVK